MFEDDFELKQEIDEDIAKILLDLQEKHNIYFGVLAIISLLTDCGRLNHFWQVFLP